MREEVLGFLQSSVVEYNEQVSLRNISTVKIGGISDFLAYPNSEKKLVALVKFLKINKIKYKILGRMSNVLPSDDNYSGVVIRTDRLSYIKFDDTGATCGCGISLPKLARCCANAGLGGLEELSGIPGSLGGAIYGNAGAYGRETGELVKSVILYDYASDNVIELDRNDLGFDYRHSILRLKNYILLSASLALQISDKDSVLRRISEISRIRRNSQPTEIPSLGSSFKRCDGEDLPWQLIDRCGLRGYRIGGAAVSNKHAGFIVNLGDATAKDYLDVAKTVEEQIFNKYSIKLEREFELM